MKHGYDYVYSGFKQSYLTTTQLFVPKWTLKKNYAVCWFFNTLLNYTVIFQLYTSYLCIVWYLCCKINHSMFRDLYCIFDIYVVYFTIFIVSLLYLVSVSLIHLVFSFTLHHCGSYCCFRYSWWFILFLSLFLRYCLKRWHMGVLIFRLVETI